MLGSDDDVAAKSHDTEYNSKNNFRNLCIKYNILLVAIVALILLTFLYEWLQNSSPVTFISLTTLNSKGKLYLFQKFMQ